MPSIVVGRLGYAKSYGIKASKFSDTQKLFVMKQDEESMPVAEISR